MLVCCSLAPAAPEAANSWISEPTAQQDAWEGWGWGEGKGSRGELAVSKKKALGVDELIQEGGVDEKRNGLRHCLANEGEVVHSQKLENRKGGGNFMKPKGKKQSRD